MATQTKLLVAYSESSGAPTHFNNWASWVSWCLATFGWSQTTDTGAQLAQWLGGSVTSVTNPSGNIYTYTFSGGFTGTSTYTQPLPGQAIILSGFTGTPGTGNNGTFVVLASPAPTSTSFSVVNVNGSTTYTGSPVITLNTNYAAAETTTYPPANAANTAVWEIWTPTDALSGTYPYYLKIWYGAAVGDTPQIWLQLGNGTDGSGNLTGNTTIPYYCTINDNGGNSSNLYASFASGDSSRVSFALFDNAGGNGNIVFSVERSKNNSGADTAIYAHIIQMGTYNSQAGAPRRQQALFPAGSPYGLVGVAETSSWLAAVPATATSFSLGTTVGVSPVWPHLGCLGNPLLGVVVYMSADFADQVPFTASLYGIPHVYLPFALATNLLSPALAANTNRIAIRYE